MIDTLFFDASVSVVPVEINDCVVETRPKLTTNEQLIVREKNNVEKILNESGAMNRGEPLDF